MTAPVVLISFNRPEATRRTLEAIREAAPADLLLIADGPRPGRDEDVANCAAVRGELEAIDWPCEVHRRYNEENLGPETTIETGLDWAFDHVGEAIILEDDCLPNADFFRFCSELLERYRDTEDVWQVTGRAPTISPEIFGEASYTFAGLGAVWGWATWDRAWSAYRARSERPAHLPLADDAEIERSRLVTRSGRRYFADVARDRPRANFGWDSHWSLAMVASRGLAVLPAANLIEVIGFGPEATHQTTPIPQRPLEPIDWPLSHPADLAVHPELQRLAERIVSFHHGRVARFVSRSLGRGRVRKVVRAAVGAWRDRQMRVP